jgi:rod shape-determining protein MreD
MSRWSVQRIMILSFFVGLLLSLFPLPILIRQWWPEWLLLLIVFWSIHHPQIFSIWLAFVLGLIVDSTTGSTLAMHAIPYVFIVYLTRIWGQNFLLWTMIEQVLFIGLLLLLATLSHLFLLLFSSFIFSPIVVYIQIWTSSLVAWFLINISLVHWHKKL